MFTSLRVAVLCIVIAFVGTFAFRIQFPVIAFYSRDVLKLSALDIGLLMSVFMIGRATSSIAVGRLYYRKTIARMLPPICFGINAVIAFLYLYAKSFPLLLTLRTMQGILNGLSWVTIQVALGIVTHPRIRATVYSIYFAIGSLGISVANYVYSAISTIFVDPRTVALSLSAIGFAVALILSAFIPYAEPGRRRGAEARRARSLTLSLALFTFAVALALSFPSSDLIYIYIREVFGASRSVTALIIAIATAIATAIGFTLSIVADRLSERIAMLCTVGMLVTASCLACIENLMTLAVAVILLLSSSRTCISVSRRIAVTRAGPEGVGYINAASNIGNVIGSALTGALYDVLAQYPMAIGFVAISTPLLALYLPVAIIALVTSIALIRRL